MNVRIGFDDDVTEEEADDYTRDLLRHLERLDIDRVDLTEAEPMPGTRGDAATLLGAITLAGFTAKNVLPHIVTVIQSWLETSAQKSVTLESDGRRLHVTGRSTEDEIRHYLAMLQEDARSSENVPGGGHQ